MSRFCSLYSSSSGNCTYLAGGGTSILVDAGVSCKSILSALGTIEAEPGELSAILLTHEHIDHIKGLKVFLKRYPIPVYASTGTLNFLQAQDMVPPNAQLIAFDSPTAIGALEITPFATPHDCSQSFGFRIAMPDGRLIGIATDLGHITPEVKKHLMHCDLVMLESNYDLGMLQCSAYPYSVKRRIQSDLGHLSNPVCAEQLVELAHSGSTRFVLAHLSQNNNMPAVAHATVKSALDMEGMQEGRDYTLEVASRFGPKTPIVF